MKIKDVELDFRELQTIKCLKENLKNYIDDDFAFRITERVHDMFVLEHIRINMATKRVEKQHINKAQLSRR